MNILDTIMKAGGGSAIAEIAKTLGVDQSQTEGALGQLVPALARGIGRNASQGNGMQDLITAIQNGNHGRYLDNPGNLTQPNAVVDGNGILGHIFGNKDTSRAIATKAAQNTGLTSGIIKKLLPYAAMLAMGALSKGFGGGQQASTGTRQLTGLKGFLDFDKDGSIADDILGIVARRFFG